MTYPGGKGRAYQRIISLMPPHSTYIETHLGGGSILRRKRPALHSIAIDVDGRVIERWRASGMEAVRFVQGCAVGFLRRYDFTGDELVYSDPPYWPDARRRARCYRHDYTREDHLELLATLKALPCRVMLSGYANQVYDEELAGWIRHTVSNQTQAGPVLESLWTNYIPDHNNEVGTIQPLRQIGALCGYGSSTSTRSGSCSRTSSRASARRCHRCSRGRVAAGC